MAFNDENVGRFVRETQQAYNEESQLRDISNWAEFDPEMHDNDDLDFIQIGRITGIPRDIFSQNRIGLGYKTLAQDLTKSIWRGELMSISDKIIEVSGKHERTTTVENLTHKSIASASSRVNADQIFLPITDSYWDTVHQWHDENISEYKDNQLHIQAGHLDLRVHWLPTDRGYESVYLMNSDKLSIIQKIYEYADIPQQIKEHALDDLNEFSRGNHLMNYFAEGEHDELDLLQRVVFWHHLDPEGAFRIDPLSDID
jgi:carboxylesterase type B